MQKNILLTISLFFISLFAEAQLANWSAVLPTKFPTNASGQIHGISRVSQLKFHPTSATKMYAVSARGGLFISTDAGANWSVTPGTDFMPNTRLASVCVDFTNDQIIYLGTGDHNYYYNGNGVMKSTNGGQTFTQTSLTGKLVIDMVMDPTNHNIIVAITNQGIYKTTDAGATWVLKTASRPFDEIKQKTPVSRVLYSCTTDSAFFRSTDFGDTWSQITNGIVLPAGTTNGNGCRIAVTPADSNVVYLGMVVNGGTIYKSTDGGSTFVAKKNTVSPYLTYYANLNTSSGQGDYNFGIGVDRTNANIVYLVAHNNWKSTDGGLTWTLLTNWYEKCHTDMHQIVTSPYNNNNLYNVNDGGIFLSTDGGSNWTPKSDGIYGYEIYHGNCSPTRKDIISIGTQDNGELYSNTLGWYTNRGGDWGSQCAFDYRPSSYMVYYYQNNQRRLVNGGNSTYGLPNQVTALQDIAFHRSNPNLAFVADSFIYRTNDLTATGPTWTQIASLGKKVMAMQVSFADTNRLYIITSDNTFYVSANALSATPTFTSYTLPSTSNNRASITTIKSNPAVVYITINTQVYRSANYGATWTNTTYNLPSVNHVKIIADEYYSGNELVFIASNNAVYYKVGTATAWTIYNTNLPTRTEAIDLSIFNDSTSNSVLRYASYGRGMWETPISNLRAINANFIANQLNPCLGEAVTFSDLSTGNITSRTWSFPGGTPSTSTAVSPIVTYASNGIYSATLTVSDGVTNSTLTLPNYINTNGATIPLAEGFEGSIDPPSGWKNIDIGTLGYTWAKSSAAGGFGNSTNAMMFDNYSWNVVGEKDELITTKLNLVGLTSAALTFDLAYQIFTGYSDSLNVLVSTDCGATYTNMYAKDANGLTTAGSGGNNFVPTSSQWRTESINLNAYVGQQIFIKFQNVNGYGNKLYIDNVNIFSPPTASFTANPLNICQGSTVTFTNTSTGLASSYLWSFPGGTPATSTATNPVVTYANSGVYNVSLIATNAAGSNTSTQANYVTVNSSILPSVNISVTYFIICAGTSVTFTATPTNGGSTPSYQWKVNGTNVGTNSSTYTTSTLSNGQIVTCVMTSSTACASPTTATSNSIIMTVNQPTSSNLPVTACGSYTWSCNGTTYATSGNYTCTSLNANNCTHTTTLNLTVNANTSSSQTVTATSATYTWSVNNVTYTSSGTYTSTSLNAAGCTHTSTLILTIPANNYNCYVKNFSQPSASQMEFDIWIEWTGTNTAKLQSFQAGIDFNHAGMSNGGPTTMTGSFIAGTASPSLLPPQNAPTVSINATSKQFRIAAAIATTAASAQTIPPPNGFRLGRFRIDNGGVPFTTNSTPNMVWFFGTASSTLTKTTVICYLNGASSGTTVTINANHTIVNPIVLNPPGPSQSVLSNGSGAATVCSPATANIKVTITGGTSPYTIVYTDGTNNFTVNNYISGTDIPVAQTGTYSLVSVTATGGGTGLNLNSGTATVNINTCTATLNLKCHIQGYYLGANNMTNVLYNEAMETNPSTNVDTVTVELRNAAIPHNLEGTYKGVLQSNGTITCTYPGTVITKSCYVVVRHRNTLETWSSNPFTVAATNNYDFTTAANKAYGNNELDIMNENIWSMYNGDLNQDGAIDANDYLILDIDMQGFASGYYASDINGDGTVDSSDFLILDANIQGFISSITP